MSTVSIPPVNARDGEPCASCRAPLAGDQRYCLQCGTRRTDAAGTSLDALVAASAPGISESPGIAIVAGTGQVQLAPAPAWPPTAPVLIGQGGGGSGPPSSPGTAGWIRANGPFLSLGSLAVGVLLVGLLLGHWSAGANQVPAPTTTKIEITGLGSLAAPAGAVAAAPVASTPGATDATASSTTDSSAGDTAAPTTPVTVPKDALDAKDLTPAEIDKAAKKGKAIVTTGTTVPKDNKPAGGGSDTLDIG